MTGLKRKPLTTKAGQALSFTELGFGAAEIGNMGYVLTADAARETIDVAWSNGLRYFDTAPLYGLGLSERRLGEALRSHKRDDYVLSSKVGLVLDPAFHVATDIDIARTPPASPAFYDYSGDAIKRSVEASLARLGVDRIDILYVHDIDAKTHESAELADSHMQALTAGGGWRALDDLRASGAVTAIGAGLNEWQLCERMLSELDPDIFLLAGRFTLLEQEPLDTFLPACEAKGVGIVVGGPFNSGVLATGARGQLPIYDYDLAPSRIVKRVNALEEVCERHGVALPQAALHYPVAHPSVMSVIPGCMSADQVRQNADLMLKACPPDLWTELIAAGLLPRVEWIGAG